MLPVAMGDWPDYNTSNGVHTSATSRKRYKALSDCTTMRLVFVNAMRNDTPGANAITVSASIETADDALVAAWFGVSRTISIPAGGVVQTDDIPCGVKAGDYFWVRTYVSVTSGQTWPQCDFDYTTTNQSWSEGVELDGADKTMTGSISFNTSPGYFPVAVLGRTNGAKAVLAFCDSIGSGFGDAVLTYKPVTGSGFVRRAAVSVGRPVVMVSGIGGDANGANAIRGRLAPLCDIAVTNFGINNITGGVDLGSEQYFAILFWKKLARSVRKLVVTTLCPASSSTDNCATVVNQTPHATASVRNALNQWLRDGAPFDGGYTAVAVGGTGIRAGQAGHPVAAICDITPAVESSQDSCKWIPGMTYDGDQSGGVYKHPGEAGHIAIAERLADTLRTLA